MPMNWKKQKQSIINRLNSVLKEVVEPLRVSAAIISHVSSCISGLSCVLRHLTNTRMALAALSAADMSQNSFERITTWR